MNAHVGAYMAWYEAAVVVYVLAAIAFLAYWAFAHRAIVRTGASLAVIGLLCQAASLGLRWRYSGHVPWNDLYGSLSVVTFAAVTFFLFFSIRFGIWFAGPLVLGIADALLAYARGWNKGLEPLVPSLQSPWILIHVPVVLCAYSAFLISFATSIVYLLKKRVEDQALHFAGRSVGAAVAAIPPEAGFVSAPYLRWLDRVPSSTKLDVITYRVTAVGEILLTVGIILGALWAHVSWGTYWQWDPKEDAALASWAVYAAYLHLHTRPSWRGTKAAWVCIAGFVSILFCYFAVNIYISGLHSYK